MRKVAIVPARKGSSRCVGKNTAIINGLSLVERTLNCLTDQHYFDQIIVSTDDEVIIASAQKYLVDVHLRDESLSDGQTRIIQVVQRVIKEYEIEENVAVAIIPVTNPLRKLQDIKEGFMTFQKSDRLKSVVSVCEVDHPIELTWKISLAGDLEAGHNITTTRKQDYTSSYRWNDAFVIDSAFNFLRKDRNLFGEQPIPFFMPPERSFYIDYPWQLEVIRLLIASQEK